MLACRCSLLTLSSQLQLLVLSVFPAIVPIRHGFIKVIDRLAPPRVSPANDKNNYY